MNWEMIFQGLVSTSIVSSVAVQISTMIKVSKLSQWTVDHDKQDDERFGILMDGKMNKKKVRGK